MHRLRAAIILGTNGRMNGRTVGKLHDEVTTVNANGPHDASNLSAERVTPTGLTLSDNTAAARPNRNWRKEREGRAVELKLQIILDEHDSTQPLADNARQHLNIILGFGIHRARVMPPDAQLTGEMSDAGRVTRNAYALK